MKKYYFVLLITSLFLNISFGQNNTPAFTCGTANPACAGNGFSYPNVTGPVTAEAGINYGCLASQPRPTWFYFQIGTSGPISFHMEQGTTVGQTNLDVDYICWGPFTAPTCGAIGLNGHIAQQQNGTNACSFSPAATEDFTINAVAGQYYMLMITNYASTNNAGFITLSQTQIPNTVNGTTNCDILCPLSITGGNTSTCANTSLTANYLNSVVSPTTAFNWTYLCTGCTTPPVPVTGSAPIATTTPRGTKSNKGQPLPAGTYSVTATSPGCLNPLPATTVILPPVQAPINPTIVVEACTDATFNLTSNTSVVLAGLTGSYTVRYHHSEQEAIDADPFIGDTSLPPVESLTNYVGLEGERIWMSITDNVLGCVTTTSFTLHFVSCAFTALNSGPICEGETFGLTADAGPGYTYIWSGPDGFSSTLQNPVNIPQPVTPPFTYTCVATNGTITSNSSTTLFVKPKPVVVTTLIQPNLLTDVQTICSGGTTDFGLSSLISGATFSWTAATLDVSNATSGSGNSIIQTLTNSSSNIGTAIYSITPTADGCVGATKNITITVNPAPVAIATPTPDTICSGETTNILLTSLPAGATFTWTGSQTNITGVSPGNGSTISQTLTATTLIGNANYAIVPSLGGCEGAITRIVQNVNPIPNVTATPVATAICSGDSTVIPLTSLVAGTTFAWTVVPNANITGAIAGNGDSINQSLTNTSLLTQTVDYLITPTANGCVGASITVSITIQPTPLATIIYNGTPFCAGTSFANVTFTGTTGGVFSSNPLGLLFDANGNVDLASPAGTYTVSYTIAANGGCPEVSFTTPLTINSITTPVTDFSYTTPVCSNSTSIVTPIPISGFTSGGTYTSTTGLIIDPNTGIIDLALSTAGNYTVTYTVPATTCGPIGTYNALITITAAPTATINYSGTPFCASVSSAQAVTLLGTNAYLLGSYSSTAGLDINITTGAINPNASLAGNYVVTYTIPSSAGCVADSTTTTNIVVTAVPTATISYLGTPFCSTLATAQPVTLAGTIAYTGGTFSSTTGLSLNSATGEINPSLSTAGNYTITYTIPATGGCPAVANNTTTVTITAAPTATINYSGTPFCASVSSAQAVTLLGTNAYLLGSYSSTAGLDINTNTGAINPNASIAGNYVVTYTIPSSAGCVADSTTTTNIVVTAVPTATISYLGTPFCSTLATAQPVTLAGTFAYTGGTFSSTTGLSLNSATGEINPSLSTAGNYTITYTIPATGGCPAVANNTTTVTITAAPTATINYSGTPFCASVSSAQAATLIGTNAYLLGSYSSTAGLDINTTTGAINPNASIAGNYVVTYTIPSSAGCNADSTTTTNIVVTAVPTATISYLGTPFCSTLATAQPVTLAGTFAYTGGTFSSTTGLSLNSVTGEINPSLSTAGNYSITYTIPATGGCPAVANNTTTVTITAAPTATINYSGTPFCASVSSAQAATLIGTNAYLLGSYSSTAGLDINTTTGAINPNASIAGNYVVTYTIPSNAGCTADSTTTTNIVVTAVPTATISYLGTPFCSTLATAQPVTLAGTFAYTGGTFSSTTGLSLNSVTGEINPSLSTAGNYSITYTVPATGGCPAVANNTTTVTITAAPTATINYSGTPFCASVSSAQAATLIGTNAYLLGSYSSTAGLDINTTTGAINPNASIAGNYVVTYTIPSSAGCVADSTTTTNIVVTAVPTAAINYSSPSFCTTLATAQPVNLSGTFAFAGGSYSSTAGLSLNGITGEIIPNMSIPSNYVVTYTIPASAGCAAVTNITTNVIINPIPVANPIPTVTICSLETTNILLGSTPIGATFDWTVLENSVSGASSGTTDLIAQTLTNNSASQGTAVYTITPTLGGCSGLPITATVKVNPLPTVSISGTSTICFGSSALIDFSGTPNAIVTYTVNGGANQTVVLDSSGLKSVSTGALNADTIYELVSITSSGTTICSKTLLGSVLISVIPIPLVSTVVASPKVCSGQSTGISLSSNVANANFSWTAISNNATGENAGTGNIISDNVTATGVTIGSVTYSIIANVGSCSGPVKLETITVNPIPVITLSTSVNNICSGNTTSFGLSSNVTNTTFSWNVIQTNAIGASDGFGNSITQTLVATSNNVGEAIYSITPIVNGCPGIPKLATVNVYPIPVASANVAASTICSGMSTNILLSSTVPGTSFNWTVIQSGLFGPSSGSGATISQMLSTIGIITGTVTYTITPEINGCFGNPITVTIIVNPTPEVFGSSAATICSGESPNISLFPSITATTFSWTVATIGVTGAQSGTGNTIDDILEADSIAGTAVYTVTPDANNCSGAPLNITVNVNPLPKPLIENGIICVDATSNIAFKTYILDTKLDPLDFDFVWYFNGTIVNGEVAATLEADEAGTYEVLVTNTATGCKSVLTSAIVTPSSPGTSVSSTQTLAFSDNATVEVIVPDGTATFYYSMDEGALQLSNIFTDVAPGLHSIQVTDINGCTNLTLSVNIIGYPTYFTPNGDGIHDTWNIIGLNSSDKVSIFDRYGKLVKQISAATNGWDGTFNGQMLTATDYWFTIDYVEPSTGENKVFKAHFSLKR